MEIYGKVGADPGRSAFLVFAHRLFVPEHAARVFGGAALKDGGFP